MPASLVASAARVAVSALVASPPAVVEGASAILNPLPPPPASVDVAAAAGVAVGVDSAAVAPVAFAPDGAPGAAPPSLPSPAR